MPRLSCRFTSFFHAFFHRYNNKTVGELYKRERNANSFVFYFVRQKNVDIKNLLTFKRFRTSYLRVELVKHILEYHSLGPLLGSQTSNLFVYQRCKDDSFFEA